MRLLTAFAALLFCAAPMAAQEPPRFASADALLRDLEATLRPFVLRRDALIAMLRADSGRARADALLVDGRAELTRAINDVAFRYYDSGDFQRFAMTDTVRSFVRARGLLMIAPEGASPVVDDSLLLRDTRRFVSASTRAFLAMTARDQHAPAARDGSREIPWSDVSDRLAGYERFIAANPASPALDDAQVLRRRYLGVFLHGMGDDAIWERRPNARPGARKELREAYARHVATHAGTPSAEVVRELVRLLDANMDGWSPALESFWNRHVPHGRP